MVHSMSATRHVFVFKYRSECTFVDDLPFVYHFIAQCLFVLYGIYVNGVMSAHFKKGSRISHGYVLLKYLFLKSGKRLSC